MKRRTFILASFCAAIVGCLRKPAPSHSGEFITAVDLGAPDLRREEIYVGFARQGGKTFFIHKDAYIHGMQLLDPADLIHFKR